MKTLKLALGFLTVLPAGRNVNYQPGDLGRAAGWFALIGAGLGALTAAAYYAFGLLFPPLLAAALGAAVWVGLSGGLHLDGLADCCDGLFNPSGRERRLEIMKDPRLGTFGGLGLILALLLKVAVLYSLPIGAAWLALPLAGAVSRWLLLPAGRQPLARPGGMGADYAAGLSLRAFVPAALTVAALAPWAGWRGPIAVAAAHLVAWGVFRLARAHIGGVTGDVFGLLVEVSELAALLVFCVR